MSTKMDSTSVCSSIPSSSNIGPKKRSLSRLSFRRLFYNTPFLNHQSRLSSHRKRAATMAGPAASEIEVTNVTNVATNQSMDCEITSLSSQSQIKIGTCELVECPLCLSELPLNCFPAISTCPHRSCFDCLRQYLRIEITESRVNISCPECTEPIHPNDLKIILNNEALMEKYEDFMLRRMLVSEPDARWCPAPDCNFAVIASGCASCPKLKCERPGCNTHFCYHCKQEWHPNQTCDAARAQRSPNVRSSSISFSQDSAIHNRSGDDIKSCPRCNILIVKMDDGSCNHMTCAVCGSEFCWLCMKEISDLHYLSPSGCTFWGKKPWSRKKKILWQLGTLVGAPVGIGLVAGIAVPAMIIGIPVWVGRKIHSRFENASKHKRNIAITSGVTASILVSPILAGLVVGIGVPILLAYVYGVVPISLCRSGGCGVTTSASGVRIEFDDENDLSLGASGHVPDAQSVDMSGHRVANPSIGEVSFGMSASLSTGSGSHLDRMGLVRDSDRESASNTAIAGASLTGSIISSMTGAPTGHRLEVQADVSSNKRFSFSSETASMTVSLSERSATFSVADDNASTKALAGSMFNYRDREDSYTSCTPVEVHVDPCTSNINPHDEIIYVQCKDDEPSLTSYHEDTASMLNHYNEAKYKYCKQVNVNSSEDDDSVSEKVRFDDNVRFIDDPPTDELWIKENYEELKGFSDPQLFRVRTEIEDEINRHVRRMDERIPLKPSDNKQHAVPSDSFLPGTAQVDVRISLPSSIEYGEEKSSLDCDSEVNSRNSASWATRQSLPCILMKEPGGGTIRTDVKHV